MLRNYYLGEAVDLATMPANVAYYVTVLTGRLCIYPIWAPGSKTEAKDRNSW